MKTSQQHRYGNFSMTKTTGGIREKMELEQLRKGLKVQVFEIWEGIKITSGLQLKASGFQEILSETIPMHEKL